MRWWRREFAVYRLATPAAAAIRARHLASLTQLTPLLMLINVLGAALLVSAVWPHVPAVETLAWSMAVGALCAQGTVTWFRRRRSAATTAPANAIKRVVRSAVLLSVPWALATALWYTRVPQPAQQLTATIMVGFMCGGAFALASVPQAALAYLAVMTVGSMVALLNEGGLLGAYLQLMVLVYFFALSACAIINARIQTARLVSESESERRGQLVSLLLRDFEEHTADLLWETDEDGRTTHGSDRLAATLGTSPARLRERGLLEALRTGAEADHGSVGELADALGGERPFRDLCLRVATAQGPRWWSFSGKPLRGDRGSKEGWRGVITDVTRWREAQQRMEVLAHYDSLTGLANRALLAEHVAALLRRIEAEGSAASPAALVCFDVDHFKSINDTLGHSAGDAVLVVIAQRLRACLRQADLAARLGGDEFAVIVSDIADAEQLLSLTARLVRELCQPCTVQGSTLPLSVSIGVALVPEHGRSFDDLLVHADLALYAAKGTGRGRCEYFEPRLGQRHRRQALLAQELRGALGRGELALAWQPQATLTDGRIDGVEALLRWQHAELGTVSPAEFIPIAERSGLIVDLGAWALHEACHGARTLPARLDVAVNVSPVQLMRDDFTATVRAALATSGLPAHRLALEVTESLLMGATPVALANLHALRALGVRVQLDDFGTGYSALAYLRKFPFDAVKIDRAFVGELTEREDARAIVRAIVELARSLGMSTIAEGVEQEDQLAVLRAAGCALAQGYLIARPMPLPQLQELLATAGDRGKAARAWTSETVAA